MTAFLDRAAVPTCLVSRTCEPQTHVSKLLHHGVYGSQESKFCCVDAFN